MNPLIVPQESHEFRGLPFQIPTALLPTHVHVAALRDPMTMERANLLNMAKLSIKGLIESALSFGRTLDSDYPPLQQFFVVMEHCLKHGLKGKGGVTGNLPRPLFSSVSPTSVLHSPTLVCSFPLFCVPQ